MSDNLEMPKTFAELEAYTSRILASQQAAHDVEIARLKEEIELLRQAAKEPAMLEFTARLLGEGQADSLRKYMQETKEQLSAANAACAMKDEALKDLHYALYGNGTGSPKIEAALSASSQQVSEWERKQLEPLRAQVAMLHTKLAAYIAAIPAQLRNEDDVKAIRFTQATAEQFIAECKQRGAVKALEDDVERCDCGRPSGHPEYCIYKYPNAAQLQRKQGEDYEQTAADTTKGAEAMTLIEKLRFLLMIEKLRRKDKQ